MSLMLAKGPSASSSMPRPDSTVYVLSEASSLSVIAPGETSVRRGQPTLRNPGHLALAPNGSVLVTNTADKSVSIFPAQDLNIPAVAAVKAQAVQAQTKATDPSGQATSDKTGSGVMFNLPVIVGTVAAAMLIGAAALILAGRRRRRSEAAEDTATLEPPAEEPERFAAPSDHTPN